MRQILKKKKIVDPSAKVDFLTTLFSSFFFSGYFPFASGTAGSLASLVIFFSEVFYNPLILAALVFVSFVIGMFTSAKVIKKYGDDPSVIVIDEAVGMWLTVLIFVLFSSESLSMFYLLICFLSFRLFDILKLQPAKYYDELKSGYGIMMDDVAAGIYAGVLSCLISFSGYNPF